MYMVGVGCWKCYIGAQDFGLGLGVGLYVYTTQGFLEFLYVYLPKVFWRFYIGLPVLAQVRVVGGVRVLHIGCGCGGEWLSFAGGYRLRVVIVCG